ncbi:MAG: hypothetical protein A2X58_08065 [Nitrospirae bacterium GWC2_56_14]|nr:MAG: hypothetical protein A2X58_08065 [Nitrospirae bacterium GWC2_56_14]
MGNVQEGTPIEILLVEDNLADSDLMTEALEECSIPNNVHLARDGFEAMDFLYRKGEFTDAPRPDLIMLDLNLPKKDGREVLAEVKSDGGLKTIPIIIITTSVADEDILKSYELHANCYLTKPRDLSQLFDVVQRIEQFWFEAVRLPPRG